MSIDTSTTHEPLVGLQEAVDLGYGGYSTIRRYVFDGKLPAVRVGRRIRFKLSDLAAIAKPVVNPEPADPSQYTDSVEEWARCLVQTAPPMTDQQAAQIVAILRGGASA